MKDIIFLTGGARSGKSAFALQCAERYGKKAFLATAETFDEEMAARVQKHREERGAGFLTLEEPLHIDMVLREIPKDIDIVIVDCLTVWAGNLLYKQESRKKVMTYVERFTDALQNHHSNCILVSNEVGMGIVPDNAMAREFRDIAGSINQQVAKIATEAWFLCSGIPMRLK